MVMDLGEPLFPDVLEGSGGGHRKANQEDVGLGIGERTQPVIIFLSCSIEETQCVWLISDPIDVAPLAAGHHEPSKKSHITVTA